MPQIDLLRPAAKVEPEPAFFSSQVDDATRFSLGLTPMRSAPLAVVCGGVERCTAEYRVDRGGLRFYSVEFVAGGRGTLTLGGHRHLLGPGDLFTYGPNVPHVITSDPRSRLVKYFVDFSGPRAPKLLRECALPPGTVAQTSAPEAVLRLFDEMIATAQRRGPRSGAICALVLEQLLQHAFETMLPARSLGSKAFATFQACRRYITDHHLTIIDLNQIATACGVDAAYLCRLFKRFDRQGPYQYLTQLKMIAAGQRLGRPGTLVKQVAKEMGFADQFHFSRAFRRVHGIAPRDFQRLSASRQ